MEEEVIERCKNGDLQAFEALFEQFGRRLYGLCLRMSGNSADAEDLMQEIFMLVLTKIKTFRGEAKFSTWLYRLAVNACISHLRKRRPGSISFDLGEFEAAEFSSAPEPIVRRTALKRAIAELPVGYRTAVILHDIQGYKHTEIAAMRGISVGASKSQLFKARRALREVLSTGEAQVEIAAAGMR